MYEGDLLTKHHIAGTKITTVYVTESGSRPHECQVALSTDLTINDFGFSIDGLGREAMKSGYNVVHEPIISAIPLDDAKQQSKVYVTDHAGDEVPAFWDGTSRPWHGIALAPVTFLDGTTSYVRADRMNERRSSTAATAGTKSKVAAPPEKPTSSAATGGGEQGRTKSKPRASSTSSKKRKRSASTPTPTSTTTSARRTSTTRTSRPTRPST